MKLPISTDTTIWVPIMAYLKGDFPTATHLHRDFWRSKVAGITTGEYTVTATSEDVKKDVP